MMRAKLLNTYQQTGDSCLLWSASIILENLTGSLASNHFAYFLQANDYLYQQFAIDKKTIKGDTDEKTYCNLLTALTYPKNLFQFNHGVIIKSFQPFADENGIELRYVDIKKEVQIIEDILKTEVAFLSLSFQHARGWHITPMGFNHTGSEFYTIDTNQSVYKSCGNSIMNIQSPVPILDIGDGILFKKL